MSDLFEALRLFITSTGSVARLEVGGELDLATVGALGDRLDLLVESGTGDVDVDMAQVTFCDATALAGLVAAHHQLACRDRRLRIVEASSLVVRLLRFTDLEMMLADAVVGGAEFASERRVAGQRVRRRHRRNRDGEGAVDGDRQAPVRAHG